MLFNLLTVQHRDDGECLSPNVAVEVKADGTPPHLLACLYTDYVLLEHIYTDQLEPYIQGEPCSAKANTCKVLSEL